jgi:hypothetical protein
VYQKNGTLSKIFFIIDEYDEFLFEKRTPDANLKSFEEIR